MIDAADYNFWRVTFWREQRSGAGVSGAADSRTRTTLALCIGYRRLASVYRSAKQE